ncbi:MAG: glutamine-hydrolyzing carbamoyl-phosphate synthase small subunit [Planctomycetota bacterium]
MQDTHEVARLALEDGSVFVGRAFGAIGGDTGKEADGEVVFNTGLSGYQEVLTDPSYAGQIVTMTYPLIGNTGVNSGDLESGRPVVRGFVVRELAELASNYRSERSLSAWLAEHGVLGIAGIDTRALTRRLRTTGSLRGVISTVGARSDAELVESARASLGVVGQNLAAEVSVREPIAWSEDLGTWRPVQGEVARPSGDRLRVAALDCGAKRNIFRHLVDAGCDVTVLPWDATPEQIEAQRPDGLFVSNGPGDPSAVGATIETLGTMHQRVPTFGICLGHQLLSRALGAETFKLKFGHRGSNQPVQNLGTGKVEITSQNHGFAVDIGSLEQRGAEATHINLNDRTLEGFRHRDLPVFAVQYHPEASPGPHDARYLFDCFVEMMRTGLSPTAEQMDRAQRRRNRLANG